MDPPAGQQEPQIRVSEQRTPEDVPQSAASVVVVGLDDTSLAIQDEEDTVEVQDTEDKGFAGSLRPVQFWDDAGDSAGLQPGIELQGSANHEDSDDSDDDEEDVPLMLISQANRMEREKAKTIKIKVAMFSSGPSLVLIICLKGSTIGSDADLSDVASS